MEQLSINEEKHAKNAITYFLKYSHEKNTGLEDAISIAEVITRKGYICNENSGIKRSIKEKYHFYMKFAKEFYCEQNIPYNKAILIEDARKFALKQD